MITLDEADTEPEDERRRRIFEDEAEDMALEDIGLEESPDAGQSHHH